MSRFSGGRGHGYAYIIQPFVYKPRHHQSKFTLSDCVALARAQFKEASHTDTCRIDRVSFCYGQPLPGSCRRRLVRESFLVNHSLPGCERRLLGFTGRSSNLGSRHLGHDLPFGGGRRQPRADTSDLTSSACESNFLHATGAIERLLAIFMIHLSLWF